MFYVSIFQRFWTFVLYNYTLQLQGKNGQNKPENPQKLKYGQNRAQK